MSHLPHQDLRCLEIQLFSSPVRKELRLYQFNLVVCEGNFAEHAPTYCLNRYIYRTIK